MSSEFDFHCHSTASDGQLSPSDVVTRAYNNGVNCLSLTDHDTTAGLGDAITCANKMGIRLVPGIELSAKWSHQCFHIIGLGIDPQNSELDQGIKRTQSLREQRASAIGVRLAKKGIPGCYESAKKIAGTGMITRTHFAKHLVEQNYVETMQQAFDRYLVRGKPGFVATEWPELERVVAWIRGAGGIPVLAHPRRYKITATRLRQLLTQFKDLGGAGIEVVCGNSNANDIQESARLARRFELSGSVGSDFHSPDNKWIELGRLQPLPDDVEPVWNSLSLNG